MNVKLNWSWIAWTWRQAGTLEFHWSANWQKCDGNLGFCLMSGWLDVFYCCYWSICCFVLYCLRFCLCFAIVEILENLKLCQDSPLQKLLASPILKMAAWFYGDMKLLQILRRTPMEQSAHRKSDKAFVLQYASSKVGHAFTQFAWTKWTSLWRWIPQQLSSPFTHRTLLIIRDLQ